MDQNNKKLIQQMPNQQQPEKKNATEIMDNFLGSALEGADFVVSVAFISLTISFFITMFFHSVISLGILASIFVFGLLWFFFHGKKRAHEKLYPTHVADIGKRIVVLENNQGIRYAEPTKS